MKNNKGFLCKMGVHKEEAVIGDDGLFTKHCSKCGEDIEMDVFIDEHLYEHNRKVKNKNKKELITKALKGLNYTFLEYKYFWGRIEGVSVINDLNKDKIEFTYEEIEELGKTKQHDTM